MAHNIKKIKTGEFGIKVPFSRTCRIQDISQNHNLCLHQRKITLPGLLLDTLYLPGTNYLVITCCNRESLNLLHFLWVHEKGTFMPNSPVFIFLMLCAIYGSISQNLLFLNKSWNISTLRGLFQVIRNNKPSKIYIFL